MFVARPAANRATERRQGVAVWTPKDARGAAQGEPAADEEGNAVRAPRSSNICGFEFSSQAIAARSSVEYYSMKSFRKITRVFSDLDRERAHLEQQEVKVINDIKKSAKAGQIVCAAVISQMHTAVQSSLLFGAVPAADRFAGGDAHHGQGPRAHAPVHQEDDHDEDTDPGRVAQDPGVVDRCRDLNGHPARIERGIDGAQTLKSQNAMAQAMKGVTKVRESWICSKLTSLLTASITGTCCSLVRRRPWAA